MKIYSKVTIVIGSDNPVKIEAVRKALSKVFARATFMGIAVPSGVSDQPMSEAETRKGAYNRAVRALKKTGADYGVGLEGGVMETEVGLMSSAWCAIVSKDGLISYGGGMHFHLPEKIASEIRQGAELGPLMDKLTGRKNVKKHGGAVEVFTNGLLTRQKAYERLVELAVTKLVAGTIFVEKA
ncbi:MAG: inosine/xanthosine triphosphatase [Patescibacteria group bacterium]|jgi:inosine/xanthosine triphosphatase